MLFEKRKICNNISIIIYNLDLNCYIKYLSKHIVTMAIVLYY